MIKATVTGRAGKATGKNKYWYNIKEDLSEEKKSINFEQVDWELLNGVANVNLVLKNECRINEITEAKLTELEKLCNFDTYQEVQDCGQYTLSTRWVITDKDGKTKARLVVRGFEEEYFMPRDKNWTVKTTDIKSAFLQGQELRRDVYIKPPRESSAAQGIVWKLKHGLYGLKDGARQFYLSVKEELFKLGCKMCEIDPAMFFVHKDGKLSGMICCHVDDFLHAGNEYFEEIMISLRKRFVAGKIEERNFDYIGFRIVQETGKILLDQSKYVYKIKNKTIDPKRAQDKESILTSQEQSEYRQLIGQINWAVQGARPDLAFELIDLSTKLKQGNIGDLSRAIKVVNRMKDIQSILSFPSLNRDVSTWKIIVFTDASLCNINSGTGSTGGHIIWLKDSNQKCCPLYWNANKIKRVVRSTIAAEALSLQEGLESGFYFRRMIENILSIASNTIPIVAYVDNKCH